LGLAGSGTFDVQMDTGRFLQQLLHATDGKALAVE